MNPKKELQITLEILAEGKEAEIPREQIRKLFGPDSAKRMEQLQERANNWIGSRSVQALGVGRRTTGGHRTGDHALVVFVDTKRPRHKIRHPVPRSLTIPGLGPVETDVVAIGRLEPEVFPDRVRPAMPGCSIGHKLMDTEGTFGLLVRKCGNTSAGTFILSNSHVIALSGLGNKGDDVLQPGPGDIEDENGVIGKLENWIKFSFSTRGFPNRVDAAIARAVRSNSVTNVLREIGVAPRGVSLTIEEGMQVYKVGRTTGPTSGEVIVPDAKVKLRHMKSGGSSGIVRFGDQVMCTRFTFPGDSGSVVLNDQHEVVGLHAAGSTSVSVFNKIAHVFSLLDIELA